MKDFPFANDENVEITKTPDGKYRLKANLPKEIAEKFYEACNVIRNEAFMYMVNNAIELLECADKKCIENHR